MNKAVTGFSTKVSAFDPVLKRIRRNAASRNTFRIKLEHPNKWERKTTDQSPTGRIETMGRKKIHKANCVLVTLFLGISGGMLLYGFYISGIGFGRSFDTDGWKRASVEHGCLVRVKMAEDLLQEGKLIGLNKEDVIELLGEPLPNHSSETSTLMLYSLGGTYLDRLVLVLQDNKVIKAGISNF